MVDLKLKMDVIFVCQGKGAPDLNTRLLVRKLWDTFHIPTMVLVDADPHGKQKFHSIMGISRRWGIMVRSTATLFISEILAQSLGICDFQ